VSSRPVLEHQILMFESSAAVTMRRPVRSKMAQYEDAVCPTVLNRCNIRTFITKDKKNQIAVTNQMSARSSIRVSANDFMNCDPYNHWQQALDSGLDQRTCRHNCCGAQGSKVRPPQ
jgi:hypothetical protein